jgi:hypothetical protein
MMDANLVIKEWNFPWDNNKSSFNAALEKQTVISYSEYM